MPKIVMASNDVSTLSTTQGSTTPIKTESKTVKYFSIVCDNIIDQMLQQINTTSISEQYSQSVSLPSRVTEKLVKTLTSVIKKQLNESIQCFIADENLGEKFKELEMLTDGKTDKQRKNIKAWRPTGLMVEQQLAAHEFAQKETFRNELQKQLVEKEKQIAEMKIKLATVPRQAVQELDTKIEEFHTVADNYYRSNEKLINN
ncbi:hypothetical protein B566_EDAN009750 [Ephemera danica]|nr:hypothetical protein B566_EDAN009750 [Ephemera danica]